MKETEFEYPGPKVLYSLSLYPFTKLLWLLTFFQFACCLPPDLSGNSLECTGQVLVGSIWYFGLVGVLGIFLIISQKWVLGTAVQSHLFPQSILCPIHSGLNIPCLRFFCQTSTTSLLSLIFILFPWEIINFRELLPPRSSTIYFHARSYTYLLFYMGDMSTFIFWAKPYTKCYILSPLEPSVILFQ